MQADHDAGGPWFRAERAAADAHPMERAGAEVRALMPWLAAEPGGEAGTKGANE
jgi:ketol-acid reductoisomerase